MVSTGHENQKNQWTFFLRHMVVY